MALPSFRAAAARWPAPLVAAVAVTALAFGVMLAGGVIVVRSARVRVLEGRLEQRTTALLVSVDALADGLVAVEHAQDGMLLTADTSFVGTAAQAPREARAALARVRDRASTDDAHALPIASLTHAVDEKLALLDERRRFAERGDVAGVRTLTHSTRLVSLTRDIDRDIEAIRRVERAHLRAHSEREALHGDHGDTGVLLLVAGTLLAIAVGVGQLSRSASRARAMLATARASEARFRALLHHYPDGAVFLIGRDERFLVAEGQALEVAGIDGRDVVGRTLSHVFTTERARALADAYCDALGGRERRIRMEREARIYDCRTVPVRDDDGTVIAALCIARDATSETRQARALADALETARASEARVRALFDAMPNSMAVIDPDTARFVSFNDAACDELGYTREEFAALDVPAIDASDDPEEVQRIVRDHVGDDVRRHLRRRHRTKSGALRDVVITSRPFQLDDRRLCYVTWLDVTEQMRADAERARLAEELEMLLSSTSECVVGMDLDARITFANRAAGELFGIDPAALIGCSAHGTLHHARPEDTTLDDESANVIERVIRTGVGAHVVDDVFWRFDGRAVPVEYTVQPLRAAGGEMRGAVVFFCDVSARHAAEAAREALEAKLRQAQKMEAVGQLAGGVAHDFNNLLTVINASTMFAREALPPESPARDDLVEIDSAARRASTLVRQLLTFSRKQPVQARQVHLGELVSGAERMLRRVIGEEIVLEVHVAPSACCVYADPGQLEQVLMNLVVNARDAMLAPHVGDTSVGGMLDIQVDACEERGQRWARLVVRDTGHGMDDATQARIFEPFFTTKAVGTGTGLGLATVFGIVAQAGGTIAVDSAPGCGAEFTVLLPASDPAESDAYDAASAAHPAHASATILLVEDESAVRTAARRMLERHGFHVLEARHGADALLAWRGRRGRIDAVVTDLRMPEMGGRELATALQLEAPRLPIVFVSGYADRGSTTPCGPREAFVEKPFTADALLHALHDVLDAAA